MSKRRVLYAIPLTLSLLIAVALLSNSQTDTYSEQAIEPAQKLEKILNPEIARPAREGNPRSRRDTLRGKSLNERWPEAKLLSLAERVQDDGSRIRVQIFTTPDLPFPIRNEQRISVSDTGGNEKIFSSSTCVANRIVLALDREHWQSLERWASQHDYELKPLSPEVGSFVLSWETPHIDGVDDTIEHLGSETAGFPIRYSEPDYIVHVSSTQPNDSAFSLNRLWGLDNQRLPYEAIDMNAVEGWDTRTDASTVTVGVIDSGIRYTHEDLSANMWINPAEIAENGIDDDNNGYVDDIHGINAISPSDPPTDTGGHGTHVSGTIGAVGNNQLGSVGVAWRVQLMALRYLNTSGSGAVSDAVRCIDYGVEMGAQILNASWGGYDYSQSLDEALLAAQQAGVIFVLAAGNDGRDNDSYLEYPSSYTHDNIVAVANIGIDGKLDPTSNYGETTVDIAAPGTDIYSSWIFGDSSYETLSGTSMAAPHITGALALQLAEFPEDSYKDQIARLYLGISERESLQGLVAHPGMPNLAESLTMPKAEFPPFFEKKLAIKQLVPQGSTLSLESEIRSESPTTIAWSKDSQAIQNEHDSQLKIYHAQISDTGYYEIAASNANGTRYSHGRIEVVPPREDLAFAMGADSLPIYHSGNASWQVSSEQKHSGESSVSSGPIEHGSRNTLATQVHGPGTLSFYWKVSSEAQADELVLIVNGIEEQRISGDKDWALVETELLENQTHLIEWSYRKDASVSSGLDTVFIDALNFAPTNPLPPRITRHPSSLVVEPSAATIFSVSATPDNLSYQWYKDGEEIAGATQADYTIASATIDSEGDYSVTVSNESGTTRSREATLAVGLVPASLVRDLSPKTLEPGQTLTLTAEATGTQPLTYSWTKDGEPLPGETAPSLKIDAVSLADSGTYQLFVYNSLNPTGIASKSVRVSVLEETSAPLIITQPTDILAEPGNDVAFEVVSTGTDPIRYQWERGGVVIPSATDSILEISSIGFEDAGLYRVVIQNELGQVTSRQAELTVAESVGPAIEQDGLDWSLSGKAKWVFQTNTTSDGIDALQANAVANGQSAGLSATIEGPSLLAFSWKCSTEFEGDPLQFHIDDELAAEISGERDWARKVIWIPTGLHTIRWTYQRDGHGSGGKDAVWLDQVHIESSSQVTLGSHFRELSHEGGAYRISVDSSGSWSAVSESSWVTPIRDESDPTFLLVKVDPSSSPYPRLTYLHIGDKTHEILQQGTESISLSEAIDFSNANIRLKGDQLWLGQTQRSSDGIDAAQTAPMGHNEKAELSLQIKGPGFLNFCWAVDSEPDYDLLSLLIDDETVDSISGNVDWVAKRIHIPQGNHDVTWRFQKDEVDEDFTGLDAAWVDRVSFESNGNVFIKRNTHHIDSTAQVLDIEIESDEEWISENSNAWIVLSPSRGYGSQTIRIEVEANPSEQARKSLFYIGNTPVTINQFGLNQIDLAEAIELPNYALDSDGTTAWFGQTATSYDGTDSGRSGSISDQESSLLQAVFHGPLELSFQWKVSSQASVDTLSLSLDNELMEEISGEIDWQPITVQIPAGMHTVQWRYRKNHSRSENEDAAWIDSVALTRGDFSTWLQAFFDEETIDSFQPTHSDADPDQDGWSNHAEYLLQTDPSQFSDQVKIQIRPFGNRYQLITGPIRGDTQLDVLHSEDLQNWERLSSDSLYRNNQKLEYTAPAESNRFYRLHLQIEEDL